jgi:hypothetical protein
MKKFFFPVCAILSAITPMAFASAKTSYSLIKNITGPRATFEKIWVDYDITEAGVKGMRIHVKFTVYEMKGIDGHVAIFFENASGTRLRDQNKKYNSSGGDVAVYKDIKPQYDPAVYNDLDVFMPYGELDLTPGKYNLTMDVRLIYTSGDLIQDLTSYDFEYTKPGDNSLGGAPAATATYEDMWVDYDVTENGRKGMRIHVKFRVFNMKNIDSYLAIYFEKKNGDKLKTNNNAYASSTGQVALYRSLLPSYDETVYDDINKFMPYDELNISGSGKFDLKMEIDVIYKNGDMVKHLKDYNFIYTQ